MAAKWFLKVGSLGEVELLDVNFLQSQLSLSAHQGIIPPHVTRILVTIAQRSDHLSRRVISSLQLFAHDGSLLEHVKLRLVEVSSRGLTRQVQLFLFTNCIVTNTVTSADFMNVYLEFESFRRTLST